MAAATTDRKFDLVIFGVTGYTGKLVVETLARHSEAKQLRWAVAGRSERQVRDTVSAIIATPPTVIVADCGDAASLVAMAQQCRVLLSCVGPYMQYGEPVVRACLEMRTHYIDCTGEPHFIAGLVRRYHDQAVRDKVLIVPACGFDSIPADLACYQLLKRVRNDLAASAASPSSSAATASTSTTSAAAAAAQPLAAKSGLVECGVKLRSGGGGGFLGALSHGTFQTVVASIASKEGSRRPALGYQNADPKRRLRYGVHWNPRLRSWVMPWPTCDPLVVQRTQRLALEKQRGSSGGGAAAAPPPMHFEYAQFVLFPGLVSLVLFLAAMVVFVLLVKFGPTRRLVQRLKAPGSGPERKTHDTSTYAMQTIAQVADASAGDNKPQARRVEIKATGTPGYQVTADLMVEMSLALLHEADSLQWEGGVVTPASLGDSAMNRAAKFVHLS